MPTGKNRIVIGGGLIVLLVVLAGGAWAVVDLLGERKDFSMSDRAGAANATLLSVDTANARVSLKPSKDSAVHVSASGKYTDTEPKVKTTTSGKTITVSQSCSGDCDIQLDIELPVKLAAKVSSGDSWTTAHDLGGKLDISTRAGAIDLSDTTGQLELHSTSGQIKVAGASADRFAATAEDGEVRAVFRTAPTQADVTTKDGAVDLALPSSDYYIQAASANGTPKIGLPIDRNAEHTVTVKTNNGGIDIHR